MLHNFGAGSDGAWPYATLVTGRGPGGRQVLYGTTPYGGTGPCVVGLSYGCGTAFSLTAPASPGTWTEEVLYSFTGAPGDGMYPYAGLVIGSGPSGHPVLCGTTAGGNTTFGGSFSAGTVFSLTPPVSPGGGWTEALWYTLPGASDSEGPSAGLAIGSGHSGHPVFYSTTGQGGSAGLGTIFNADAWEAT